MQTLFKYLAGSALALAAGAAHACTQAELASFVARAQDADRAALADGAALSKCPLQASVAVQWQAFLLAASGDASAAMHVDEPAPASSGSGRAAILQRARAGAYTDLLARVDHQEVGYATADDAQLVLARVLVRKGLFARGREAYQIHLRLAPTDDEAEAEYLYSFLWEGRYAEADQRFAQAAAWTARPGFAEVVQRGRALSARLQASSAAPAQTVVPGTYRAVAGIASAQGAYSRHATELSYSGLLDAKVGSYSLNAPAFGGGPQQGSELSLGYSRREPPVTAHAAGLGGGAHAGYFSPGTDHWYGDAVLTGILANGLGGSVGGYRTPVALLLPLAPEAEGLMRDGVYTAVRFKRYVELRGELQKDKGYEPTESHTAVGRIPLVTYGVEDEVFYARIPATYELNPRPNPNYTTNPQQASVGAGFELLSSAASRWTLDLTADYDLVFVTTRANTEETRQTGLAQLAVEATYPVGRGFRLVGAGHYVHADDLALIPPKDRVSSLSFGVSYGGP